jgi:class 3 adenylate cyclase
VLEVGKGALWLRDQLEKGTAPGPWLEPGSGGYQRLHAGGYQQMLVFDQPGSFPLWNLRQVLAQRLAALLAWLNQGMSRFVPAITTRGGMVNKFTGDGLLAVFGAPLSDGPEADALAAVEAALAIQGVVEELNVGLAERGERLEYAVIGDAVDCASRLESVDKERRRNRCRVLVSTETRTMLPPALALRWDGWGRVARKGRQEPLEVWELLGTALSPDSEPDAVPATPTSARP